MCGEERLESDTFLFRGLYNGESSELALQCKPYRLDACIPGYVLRKNSYVAALSVLFIFFLSDVGARSKPCSDFFDAEISFLT